MQAAAGFLVALDDLPDLTAAPFAFPPRYAQARALIAKNVRTFTTTSMGRLFDTVAALLGFTREITFEGQAAMWLEHLAAEAGDTAAYPLPLRDDELDFRPLLAAVIADRVADRSADAIARAFHGAIRDAVVAAACAYGPSLSVVVSGGVFQNRLLIEMLHQVFGERLWTNRIVPPNDGGICLGQAALSLAVIEAASAATATAS